MDVNMDVNTFGFVILSVLQFEISILLLKYIKDTEISKRNI